MRNEIKVNFDNNQIGFIMLDSVDFNIDNIVINDKYNVHYYNKNHELCEKIAIINEVVND